MRLYVFSVFSSNTQRGKIVLKAQGSKAVSKREASESERRDGWSSRWEAVLCDTWFSRGPFLFRAPGPICPSFPERDSFGKQPSQFLGSKSVGDPRCRHALLKVFPFSWRTAS